MTEYAGYQYNFITVPLYDTLGAVAIEFIVNQTEMTTIVATPDKALVLLKMKSSLPTLKTLIIMGTIDHNIATEARTSGIDIYTWTDIENIGAANPVPSNPPKPSDIATICYTSGTTGTPKYVYFRGYVLNEIE